MNLLEYSNSILQGQAFLYPNGLDVLYHSRMDIRKAIGAWIKASRLDAELSQESLGTELANLLGVERGFTKGNISHWETAKHEPNLQQLMAISRITNKELPAEIQRALGGSFAPVAVPRSDEEITALELVELVNDYYASSAKDRKMLRSSAKVAAKRASVKKTGAAAGHKE